MASFTSYKVKRYIKTFKEEVKSFVNIKSPFQQLALATEGNAPFLVRDSLTQRSVEPLSYKWYLHFFGVGEFPKTGASHWLANWKSLYTYSTEAQEEIERILNVPGACHAYIASEAVKLSRDSNAMEYKLHIIVGAETEDYILKPGETILNVLKETEYWVSRLLKKIFEFVAKIWKIIVGDNVENDLINRPYWAHFYKCSHDEKSTGLSLNLGKIKIMIFQSALDRLKEYWEEATKYYQSGDKSKAYKALGHMVHLVSDLHVPAHVHNDIHGPTRLLGKPDSFEQWLKRCDYPHIQRGENNMNITIWSSASLNPPIADNTWEPHNINEKLEEFVNNIVKITRQYKSVDVEGENPDQKNVTHNQLTDDECYYQAQHLIPLAIKNSSQLIVNFINYQKMLEARNKSAVE